MRLISGLTGGFAVAAAVALSGCAGLKTFSPAARAGDTVGISLGWNPPVSRANLRILITSGAANYDYVPGDPNIRVVANVYPDPASRLIVGRETDQGLGVSANVHAQNLEASVTGGDKDYSQTMVLVNLPATLPVGPATIRALDATTLSQLAPDITVEIVGGGGSPAPLTGPSGTASPAMLATLERAAGKSVSFSGPVIPYAVQLDLIYTPGSGTPWIVNPRGDLKNVSWALDGSGARLKVMLLPANHVNPSQWSAFKFFVAGGLSGLEVDAASVKAFDSNGNPVAGIAVQLN